MEAVSCTSRASGRQQCPEEAKSRSNPLRTVRLAALRHGNHIRGTKTETGHFLRDAVRVLFQDVEREGTVLLIYPRSVSAGNAVHFQPKHDLLQLRLLVIGFVNFLRRLFPDARNFLQAARGIFDDVQRLRAELRHDTLRHCGADSLHRAGG